MRFNYSPYIYKNTNQAWLYSFVFSSKAVVFTVLFLLLSFFIQPLHKAAAAETPEPEATIDEVFVADDVKEQVEVENMEESEEVVDNSENEDEISESELEPNDVEENEQSNVTLEDSSSEQVLSTEGATSTENDDENTTTENSATSNSNSTSTNNVSSQATASSSASSTVETDNSSSGSNAGSNSSGGDDSEESDEDSTEIGGENSEQATSTDNTDTDEIPKTNSTSSTTTKKSATDEIIEKGVTDIVDEVVNLTKQLVTEENYYQFSRESCAPVGDGTFHCTENTDGVSDFSSGVFAEKDSQADMEIFLRSSKGEIKQITDNDYEDTAPSFDGESMRLVWQRLINGRYQIIVYDLNEGEEIQLTFSRTNNMDPKVAKEGIVWQAWDGNDWEIMYFDGQYTDQITDNEIQDVTPVIEEGYILWSVLGGKEKEARVYSIKTKEQLTISDYDGGAIINPRFVLVYDTKFENGDIVTQGFDPVTGLSAPISAQPTSQPIDIPESDPIGEIRALINNKSTENDIEIVTEKSPDTETDLNLASTTATSSDTLILDNASTTNDVDIASVEESEPEFELTEFDLVITPTAVSTTSKINNLSKIQLEENSTSSAATSTQ